MNYLGLDCHKKYSFATIITEDGEVKEKERLLNRKESFLKYLQKFEEVVAVVEACWNWPVAVEVLEGVVDPSNELDSATATILTEQFKKTSKSLVDSLPELSELFNAAYGALKDHDIAAAQDALTKAAAFLAERLEGVPGSAVTVTMEGSRPLLVEIQALVSQTGSEVPRRTANGVDFNRLLLLAAVLSKRLGLRLGQQDVFVNVVGGMKVSEPAIDLAVAAAIASSEAEFRSRRTSSSWARSGCRASSGL